MFNCPANLASHRRWHKPRLANQTKKVILPNLNSQNKNREGAPTPTNSTTPAGTNNEINDDDEKFPCHLCNKAFRRCVKL